MKTRVLLFLILTALACAPPAAGQESAAQSQPAPEQAAAWSRYTYPGEMFSVELPGMPLVFHTRRIVREMPYDSEKTRVFGLYADRVVLSSSGKVSNISVVKWLPDGLTERAIRAARHILFFPAVKDGRPVSQYVVLEYNYNIY